MAKKEPAPAADAVVKIEEQLGAPEVYATRATYFGIVGNNMTITLTSLRWDNGIQPPILKRVVVARLVMPTTAAAHTTAMLQDQLTKHSQQMPRPVDRTQIN